MISFLLIVWFGYWILRLRKSETALKSNEAKLKLILDNEPECVKIMDESHRLLQINKAGLQMLAVDEEKNLIGKEIESFVLPSHKRLFREMNNRVLGGKEYQLEFPIKTLDGQIKWMESHAVPMRDNPHDSVAILAVTRDISERKKNDEEKRIAALVYQNTSEAMMVLNSTNQIIAINPAFTRTTEYPLEDVKGKNPQAMKSDRISDFFFHELWQTVEFMGHWDGEIWNRRKNGEEYPARMIINTIYSESGEIEHRVALFSDITEQKEIESLVWKQANFDPLTHLANRNLLMDHISQEIKLANRSGQRFAVLFIDLDHFKEVNDTMGHEKGDELLIEVAKRLKHCVRESDTVARLGGDEFVIILAELGLTHNIDRVAEQIIQSLSQLFTLGEEQAYVSASIGIAIFPDDAKQASGLLKYADQAMYMSKHRGRGCFSYFTPSMQDQARSRLKLLNELRSAIVEQQFRLFFQPIIDLNSREIVKAEALIRWMHPDQGLIAPDDFIPLLEESGLIMDVGDWVFKQAVQQAKTWREKYNANLQICINKSPIQFRLSNDKNEWLDYLEKLGVPGQAIVIEITEGILMDSGANISHQLFQYRDAGIQVGLDDFGTGYSALSYLNKFHIDYLKIDRSFTSSISLDSNAMTLSEAIILLAKKLSLQVIAEGIETEQQLGLLSNAGCILGQGEYFSQPLSIDEFELCLKQKTIFETVAEQSVQ